MTTQMIGPEPSGRLTFRSAATVAVIALLVAALIGIVVAVIRNSGSPEQDGASSEQAITTATTTTSATSSSSTSEPPGPDPDLVALLTVNTVTEHCPTVKDGLVKFDVAALQGVPPRKWSDALSTPLGNQGRDGVDRAVCTDPLFGVTVANMLSTLKVDGVTVASLNSWLNPFTDTTSINDRAAEFIPLLDVTDPSDAQVKAAAAANRDYQQLANRVNTLLSRFQVSGIQTLRSLKNWHLADASMVVGSLPEVELDSRVDAKPALVLEATLKNGCAPLVRIGFNVGDKRPEVFKAPTCKTPSKSTPPQTTRSTGSTTPRSTQTTVPSTTRSTTPRTTTTTTTTRTTSYAPPPPHSTCPCVAPTSASQPVPTPPKQTSSVPSTRPPAQPTAQPTPTTTSNGVPIVSAPPSGGANGGSTSNPVVTGTPNTGDTSSHTTAVPTPTGGVFG